MTGCHAYCVVPAGTPPPDGVRGLDGARVAAVDVARVALWVSAAPARPRPELDAIRAHNGVVEAAHALGATVPLRFGQWFADDAALARHAAERAAAWEVQLAGFEGRTEFGLRIDAAGAGPARDVHSAEAEAEAGSGRAYMARLAARHAGDAAARARGERIAARLRQQLGDLVLRERIEYSRDGATSVAHLVDAADAAAYRAAVDAAIDQVDARVTLTGPWPPYSFVE